ncbi:hypothetical protein ADL22_16495 [Streptomyces sp. NRRL F-4489]|uniref:hypothetical protein n=1 Tax=Streptomyces sp. NRRL F-4489 TaxID=1609095 RepID=UPI000748B609|nr:hypothetical protein [Streptomyces sp. NRRL F-4489]KUL38960.1 hypothetical protein ADL22_16495 [Streptomyces sp. NRRL F-4489]
MAGRTGADGRADGPERGRDGTDGQGRNGAGGHGRERARRRRSDYGGAVYGSLQAASVVAGTAAFGPFPRLGLIVLLLVTGLVFWAAHIYARLVGGLASYRELSWATVRRVAGHEWPIAQASLGPAAAVAISPLLRLDLAGTAWFALSVAVAEQIGWGTTAAVRAGASRRLVLVSAAVNLVLGLAIVVAKAELH